MTFQFILYTFLLAFETIDTYAGDLLKTVLNPEDIHEGVIEINGKVFHFISIDSSLRGSCLKIQPDFNIKAVPYLFKLEFKANSNLSEMDQPKKISVFMTSKIGWHGIVTNIWPQFQPSVLELDINSFYFYIVSKTTEYVFAKVNETPEDCFSRHIQTFSCPRKCQFASFSPQLPMCKDSQEFKCIIGNGYLKNMWARCSQVGRGLAFYGHISRIHKQREDNWTTVAFDLNSMLKEIREEVDVITMSEFIGSVGGSLGMFFGFSIATHILFLFDKL